MFLGLLACALQSPAEGALRALEERLFGRAAPSELPARLELVAQDSTDGITRGRSWRGTPYQIGEKVYAHGLAFNATKRLAVKLDRPGARFRSEVGLENNDDTRRGATLGNGSVRFHVFVGGKERAATPVMRLADAARPIDVPLEGALEFEIAVDDGGDGRGWDQALWAEATIELQDGSTLRLQDVPFSSDANPFGIAFDYHGAPSRTLLAGWTRTASESALDARTNRRTLRLVDPATKLEVRLEAEVRADEDAVEYVAHLRNGGSSDTPLLEKIRVFDGVLPLANPAGAVLHWANGAVASFDDFAPHETPLAPGAALHLQPGGGRSSSGVLPFFDVEGTGGGVIAVLGWSGEWAADFSCDADGRPRLATGLAQTHLVLHAGEEIRTPSLLLLGYEGDRWDGQNRLRRYLLAHHRPTRDGKPLVPPVTCGNWGATSAEVHLDNIARIVEHELPIEYYWIDAEWFGNGSWWPNAGDWRVKSALYPQGFAPLSTALRKNGRELMLWFEPERVHRGTPWFDEHPEWLLDVGGDDRLVDLGNPAARAHLTDFISARIDEFGLGCYRQDFNIDPLGFWQRHDAPDRVGMTEIRYIEGLYTFWDELRARHPGLLIDNCASGGRRLDLETLGRATPFWRTDGPRDPIAHQCHTWGLLPWVPLNATSQDRVNDDYEFRSSMSSALCLNWWVSGDAPSERIPADFPYAKAKATLEQYLGLREYFLGDFRPLTAYSQARDVWMAYQLALPERGRGLVVALRRPESPYSAARFALHGLDAAARYRITDLDTHATREVSGAELAGEGLELSVRTRPGSALLVYEKL